MSVPRPVRGDGSRAGRDEPTPPWDGSRGLSPHARRIVGMNEHAVFRPWPRPVTVGFWLLFVALNAVFNGVDAQLSHPELPAWMPWSWECSSGLLILALLPAVVAFERRWPIRFPDPPPPP